MTQHLQNSGPNDLLFRPLVYTYRHALELILKAAIREAARRRQANGDTNADLDQHALDSWLAREAGHNLHVLAARLDAWLQHLELDGLPADTHNILGSIHYLDPRGDSFKYATVYDKETRSYVAAAQPAATHVDIVAMSEHFESAFNLLSGGVMTVLDEYRDYQRHLDLGP